MIKLTYLLKESIKVKTIQEDDRIKMSIPNIGFIVLAQTLPEYEFLDELSDLEIKKLGVSEGEPIGKIEHIEIDKKYQNQGYAKILMQKAINKAEKIGWTPIYLNASPMGQIGLSLDNLTNFYKKFGFEIFKKQKSNNLMIKK